MNKYREYFKDAKNGVLLELLDEYEKLLSKNNSEEKKEDNVLTIVKYCNREFAKRFGKDEIFTEFPIAATTVMKLSSFRQRVNIDYKTYKDFAWWLIHKPGLKQKLGRYVNVFDLCNEKLYQKFLNEKDSGEFDIKEKKKMHSKRILEI